MSKKILVTYASRLGSTAGVAGVIGKTLIDCGEQVDIIPMADVKDIDPYQAVVVGSAIRGGAWLPEALQFVQVNRKTLSKKPFAAFLVCMTLAMPGGEKYRQHVSTWLEPVRAFARPISEGLFAGSLDISKVESFADRLKFRLSVLFGVWTEGDHRDWNAIRAWAQNIHPYMVR
jgi:menaquinone-dependent protoporphyrinogen oxidase